MLDTNLTCGMCRTLFILLYFCKLFLHPASIFSYVFITVFTYVTMMLIIMLLNGYALMCKLVIFLRTSLLLTCAYYRIQDSNLTLLMDKGVEW